MKSIRMGFTKGVNSRIDPMLLGDGFLLVADNAEMRSGLIKPVRAPEFEKSLEDGTTRIFEFRGRWHFAPGRREYAAEYVGTQERVYYSDPGAQPMKIIDSSTTATLGITRPTAGLVVAKSGKIVPTGVNAVGTAGDGALSAGGYGYRIGYRTKRGYLTASGTITANVPDTGKVLLTWTPPDFSDLDKEYQPISVIIYGREVGKERVLAEIPADASSFSDRGGDAPSGQTATSYDATAPIRYCYTFERDVNGHVDESGPSDLSQAIESSSGRLIKFDANDGYDSFTKTRNLYRIGDVATLSLVAKIPITTSLNHIATVSMQAGGTGYTVNDVLTVDQYQTADGKVTVSHVDAHGAVTAVTVSTVGEGYFVPAFDAPCATTDGTGSGCTINILTITADTHVITEKNLQYLDMLSVEALGGGPDSEYDDADGMHILFGPAPEGLKRLTLHNQMMFGVLDSTVRWTPINRPDAWPDVYSVNLPHPPVALASFGGALIILAQDALYRLDGFTPGGMSLTRMPIEDGCIAPFSVQKTSHGLFYLSARGLMRYAGGMTVEPVTEDRLDSRVLLAPSTPKVEWNFWWLPTKAGQPFAAQTREHPTVDVNAIAPALHDTRVIEGPIEGIRSFVHAGRYHLYYADENHGAGTTWVIDLADPGIPITTLGLRPLDAHVTALEHCYLLLPDIGVDDDAFRDFRAAQGTVDQTLTSTVATTATRMLARFGKGREKIPWYIRSGPMSQGAPTKRKKYRYIQFFGSGTVDVRVYVDGRTVARAQLTAVQTPETPRRLNLPRSCWGYALDLEMAGTAELMAVETAFDEMPSES